MMTRLEEVQAKTERLMALMEAQGLRGILLKKQPNFSWLSGGGLNMVGIATEVGMTSLLVTRTGRYLIANRIEAGRMREEELDGLGFELLTHEWFVDREADLVREVAGELSGVGCDIPFGDCVNVDEAVKRCRFSLTENEIERYRFLGEKLSQAIEKVALGIRPGDTECEIAGRIGVDLWKDRIDPTAILVAADDRISRYRHPIPTMRMVKRYVMVSANARYKGLITTITRLVHFGRPPEELVAQYARNIEVECRMIAATRPGRPASLPFTVGVETYREFGLPDEWQLHHQGGAMGYYARDIKVTEATEAVIEPNQAFCWNPSITGTKTEDGFIATPQGPLMLTYPVIYPHLEWERDGVHLVRPGLMVLD